MAADRSYGNNLSNFIASSLDLSSFNAAVHKTGLTELLSRSNLNATVLAPTDDAFALLPPPFNNGQNINSISDPKTIQQLRQIIRYHILKGARTIDQLANSPYHTYAPAATNGADRVFFGRTISNLVFVNGKSEIIAIDIQTSNGIIQVVNRVLFPPAQDLGQIILYTNGFSTLNAALDKTGLRYTLFTPWSDFTFFAPTDTAFAALPPPFHNAAAIESISNDQTIDELRNLLLYHLVPGRIFSVDFREGEMPETALPGGILTFSISNGLKVKGAGNNTGSTILQTDLLARNGVAHVIDQVLAP